MFCLDSGLRIFLLLKLNFDLNGDPRPPLLLFNVGIIITMLPFKSYSCDLVFNLYWNTTRFYECIKCCHPQLSVQPPVAPTGLQENIANMSAFVVSLGMLEHTEYVAYMCNYVNILSLPFLPLLLIKLYGE